MPPSDKNNGNMTKTKAKKSLLVNFESEKKNKILKEIRSNFSNITLNSVKQTSNDSDETTYIVEFPDYKQAKEAKETLAKLLAKFKKCSVQSAFNQKNQEQKSSDQKNEPKTEKFTPLNGTLGDRTRNLFEIRFPKIILRNLNFNLKEEKLKAEMEKFGEIKSMLLPKKPDGKFFGYGFVTYEKMEDAIKAMNTLNAKEDKFMGTKVAVDWCLPKNIFLKNQNEDKEGDKDKNEDENDKESDDENENSDEEGSEKEDKSSNDEDDDEDEDKTSTKRKNTEEKDEKLQKKRKTGTLDVQEQRTVFVRNLSFDANEESVSEAFTKFGPVKFVKLCMDRELERPKGTAFIQFETSQGAVNACAESEMFEMDSRVLQIDMAVSRDKVTNLVEEKKLNPSKDNRNIALAKEGIIYANSYEAKTVSKADMMRRQKLEASNIEKLKNLHFFVSPTRLSVHNIPIKCTDQELRDVFLKAIDANLEEGGQRKHSRGGLVECRIMRDLARVNADGVYRSKGFGFVEFSNHELAKKALQTTNNVTGLFENGSKLIVQFSIEDMRALKRKALRVEKAERKGKNLINKNAGDFKKKPQNKKFQSRNGKPGDKPQEKKFESKNGKPQGKPDLRYKGKRGFKK